MIEYLIYITNNDKYFIFRSKHHVTLIQNSRHDAKVRFSNIKLTFKKLTPWVAVSRLVDHKKCSGISEVASLNQQLHFLGLYLVMRIEYSLSA